MVGGEVARTADARARPSRDGVRRVRGAASPDARAPAIVVAGYTMALAAVRALGESGVRVAVVHYDRRDMAQFSRHVSARLRVPPPHLDEAGFVQALARHAGELGNGVLLPASDEAVVALSRNRARLREHYLVAAPEWELCERFIEKRRTYEIAARAGVPVPRTWRPASAGEALEAGRDAGFPVLLKPSQSHVFQERFGRKLVVVRDGPELLARFGEARRAGVEVLVQEVIPGDDRAVVNYNAYAVDGRALVEFTARQLRKAPPGFGSPRAVRSERIDDVMGAGRTLLRALGVDGFACCEFKRDARDGRYKILDVNGRHNLSGLLAVRCGINFPLLQYRHLVHGEVPRPADFEAGRCWVDAVRDVAYGARYAFRERLGFREYLAPYLDRSCDAVLDRSDLRPFLARVRHLATSALRG